MDPELAQLIYASYAVINSADDEGCSEGLTVVSAAAIELLRRAVDATERRS